MAEPTLPPDGPAPGDLQFDTAEYAAPTACAVCGEAIAGPHFRIGAATVCPACRLQIEQHQDAASTPEALGRAVGYGLAAAAGAALLWLQLREMLGDFRIAAIPVAWAVTWAIRRGAGGGGTAHQVLAVVYTALAIAVYVATGPDVAWTEPSSGLMWVLVGGIALFSAWSRTASDRVPFEAVQ